MADVPDQNSEDLQRQLKRKRVEWEKSLKEMTKEELIAVAIELKNTVREQNKTLLTLENELRRKNQSQVQLMPNAHALKLVQKILDKVKGTQVTSKTNKMIQPYVEVSSEMKEDVALALIGAIGVEKKNTKRILERSLDKKQMQQMLPDLPEHCDVVFSSEANLMTTATFDNLIYKYDKKTSMLTVRVKISRAKDAGIFSKEELFNANHDPVSTLSQAAEQVVRLDQQSKT